MSITLSPEIEAKIEQKVRSGCFQSPNELIQSALEAMERYEESIQSLKASLQQGLDELEEGEGIRIQSSEDLDQLFEDIKK
jgi:antitoxin ParD1/3/4